MTEQEIIKRCYDVLGDFGDKRKLAKCIKEIVRSGCIDLQKCEQNYFPAYSIMGALFQRAADLCINGSAYESRRRQQKREARNILRFIPWWFR